MLGQIAQPMTPYRPVPVMLQMSQVVSGFDQGRPAASSRIGNMNPIRGGTKADFLLDGSFTSMGILLSDSILNS